MAISMSMGDGPGKQKKKMRKFNTAQGKAIAAQKQARVDSFNANPKANKAAAFTEKMARHNPNLEKNEYGMYKGTSIAGGGRAAKKKGGARIRPKFDSRPGVFPKND